VSRQIVFKMGSCALFVTLTHPPLTFLPRHHATPGLHWAKYQPSFERDYKAGLYKDTIIFRDCNLFVLGGMILAKDYDAIAGLVYDPRGVIKDKRKLAATIKARLQHTIW
jgi:hypothetical protein